MLSQSRIDYAMELFAGVGDLNTRKMFGGLGIYKDGTIFAIVMSDETIRLKGQGAMIDKFDQMGMERWTYQREGRAETAMPYWALTDEYLDDPEAASNLAMEAIAHL